MSFKLFTTIMGMLPGIDELNARFDKLIGHKHDKSDFNGGAITAGSIDNIASGNITSTDQQAVNAELDSRGYGDNLFLNPFFQIWQRGTSFVIAVGASAYSADRKLVINNTNQSITVTQFQYANKQYSLKVAATSTAPTTGTVDIIERSDQHELSREIGVGCLQDKYATVQFEVDGADPTFSFKQFFGTGGSPSASVDTAVTLTKTSLGGTVNKYVGSVLIPSISGKVIGTTVNTDYLQSTLSIPLRSTAVNVMVMQCQYGKVNSMIRQRSDELILCQRYYEKSYHYNAYPGSASNLAARSLFQQASTTLLGGTSFCIIKRTIPSVVIYSPSGTVGKIWTSATDSDTGSGAIAQSIGDAGFRYVTSLSPVAAGPAYSFHFTADAEFY